MITFLGSLLQCIDNFFIQIVIFLIFLLLFFFFVSIIVFHTCDPFWENVPKRADKYFSDLLIKV